MMIDALPTRLAPWAPVVLAAAEHWNVDPAWLMAIMDHESRGGDILIPHGPGGTGDGGHGRGLMQIDDRFHASFMAAMDSNGKPMWKDPWHNIGFGACELRRALDQLGGDIHQAVAAYNCGVHKVAHAVAALDREPTIADLDPLTYGGTYVSDVSNRYDLLMKGELA